MGATRTYWPKVPYAEAANPAKILQSLDKKNRKKLRYDKINPDPHAKRTARRVAATPALQSNPVGPASRIPQARACRLLECPHLAIPRAHGAKARRRFRRALCRNRLPAHLNLSPSQLPCITKSTPTSSSGNRFTTTCGSNIPNGSNQMANPPYVILTSRASRNYSTLSRERDRTSPSLLLIARSNRE